MLACAELFVEALKEKGLYYAVNEKPDGDTIIDFPYKGKVAKCVFSGDSGEYLSLYLQFENIPDEKFVDMLFACNELNCKYKWVTFYIDGDKDLMLHDDAILTVENAADEALELLIRMLNIGQEVKPFIMKTMYA